MSWLLSVIGVCPRRQDALRVYAGLLPCRGGGRRPCRKAAPEGGARVQRLDPLSVERPVASTVAGTVIEPERSDSYAEVLPCEQSRSSRPSCFSAPSRRLPLPRNGTPDRWSPLIPRRGPSSSRS